MLPSSVQLQWARDPRTLALVVSIRYGSSAWVYAVDDEGLRDVRNILNPADPEVNPITISTDFLYNNLVSI
jgi:hypothetical protein